MRTSFGEYELDTEARTLRCRQQRVPVQPRAFDLLAYLIEHRDRVVSANELLDALWPDLHVTPGALSTAVQKARHAVGDDGEHQVVLHTEYGHGFRFVADARVEPAAEAAPEALADTRAGRTRIRRAAAAGAVALALAALAGWLLHRAATVPESMRSVAVLPFANLSEDPANEVFASGIHDDVLTQISKIRDLKVIARTTVEHIDPKLSIREVGSRLGVAAVLQGGVQRAGDRIRINVQLVDCETQVHLWAETYDREFTAANLFDIQSNIARSVASALRATLSPQERERTAKIPTQDLAAYQAYLLGQNRFRMLTSAALEAAIDYFQRAIELDPAFARAHVALAEAYLWQTVASGLPEQELLAKARAMVDRALELDDELGEAYAALGWIKYASGDAEGAEAEFRRALELNPNHATAYCGYGELLRAEFGRPEDALKLHRRGIELDPLSGENIDQIGRDLSALYRPDEAVRYVRHAIEMDPDLTGVLSSTLLNHYFYAAGRLDEAAIWIAEGISLDPGDPGMVAAMGELFLDLGDLDAAEFWIGRSIQMGSESRWPRRAAQLLHLYRDDEAALASLHESPRPFTVEWDMNLLPRLHQLRAGRYSELIASIEEIVPELLNEKSPEVDTRMEYRAAVDLALPLSRLGQQERADRLLERSLQHIQTIPRIGFEGHWVADVQIYALQGKKRKALAALRQAIDEGWRAMWWYYLQREPNLESLHGEPEFQEMVAEIEADMAAQLARVREMQRGGELVLAAPE